MIKEYMKQTVEEAAISSQCEMGCQDCPNHAQAYDGYYSSKNVKCPFILGAEWQSKQSPWISVKERLPDENEDIIILCKHGAIFNGTYSNNVWFCMDGYIYDTYKGNPIYSSMSSIPPSWEPIAWMPKPKFEE